MTDPLRRSGHPFLHFVSPGSDATQKTKTKRKGLKAAAESKSKDEIHPFCPLFLVLSSMSLIEKSSFILNEENPL